jgi:tetratricopeptide (TPR) repeat protein
VNLKKSTAMESLINQSHPCKSLVVSIPISHVSSQGCSKQEQDMKRISQFSTAFLPTFFSLGLIIAAAPARIAAQITSPRESKEQLVRKVEDAKQKIAKNSDDASEHYRLGGLYVKLFQLQDAVAAFSQAVRIKPDFAYAYYDLGWCYARLDCYCAFCPL